MSIQTWSEKYALAAAIALLFLVILDNAVVMFVVALAGLVAGLLIAWRASLKRAGVVALAGFAVAIVFAVFVLLRH
ncbi:MAG: hypothetical protein NT169_10890 [Chloroflexi bacterium]|nr:hypothetical protein [Chloroflexota bacterium]